MFRFLLLLRRCVRQIVCWATIATLSNEDLQMPEVLTGHLEILAVLEYRTGWQTLRPGRQAYSYSL